MLALQALISCIKMPKSALVSYVATDTDNTSVVARSVAHKSLSYKVCLAACTALTCCSNIKNMLCW